MWAAKQVRKSKTTPSRAVKSGKISATCYDDGFYSIDPAELARAYLTQPDARPENGSLRDLLETSQEREVGQLRLKVEMLEAMLAREQEGVTHLRTQLDRADGTIVFALNTKRNATMVKVKMREIF